MAIVSRPDGSESFEVADGDAQMLAYYAGEGFTVSDEGPATGVPTEAVEHPADGTMSPEVSNPPAMQADQGQAVTQTGEANPAT